MAFSSLTASLLALLPWSVQIPGTGINVSWIVLLVAIAIGLLLIRTAFTLIKVLIVVAIAVALWFLVNQFL